MYDEADREILDSASETGMDQTDVDIKKMTGFYNIIYSFHMPLFFFVSGYLEEKRGGEEEL